MTSHDRQANRMALKRIFKRHFAVMSESVGDLNVLHRPLEKASVRPQDPVTGTSNCRLGPWSLGQRRHLGLDDRLPLSWKRVLWLTCTPPHPGYTRDGYCRSHPGDGGKHTLAAVLTPAFLDFSKSRGNDLSTPRPAYGFPGLKDGCRWCLCVEVRITASRPVALVRCRSLTEKLTRDVSSHLVCSAGRRLSWLEASSATISCPRWSLARRTYVRASLRSLSDLPLTLSVVCPQIDALKTVPLADMQRFAQHEPPTGRPAPQR